MGLVGLVGGCLGGAEQFDQGIMNFIEVTALLLPTILMVVLFIRLKLNRVIG